MKRNKSQSEHREIYVSKEDFEELRSDRGFIILLTLARSVNALYFCFRSLLDYSNDNTPTGLRQHINSFLFSGAVLYEALLVADKLEKHFGDRDSYHNGFGTLLKEGETKLLRKKILERIRNTSTFHYNEGVTRKTIKTIDLPSYLFATGRGSSRSGTYYNLSDEMVIEFLFGGSESREELDRVFRATLQRISKLLVSFTEAADMLIGDILAAGNWQLRKGNDKIQRKQRMGKPTAQEIEKVKKKGSKK
jgi:hypothetical protein